MIFHMQSKGDWSDTFRFLKEFQDPSIKLYDVARLAAEEGLQALKDNTPVLTGRLRSSWMYKIRQTNEEIVIEWHNYDIEGGENIALVVQYGHVGKGGHYIVGRDYINPAMEPLFNRIAEDLWKEVSSR